MTTVEAFLFGILATVIVVCVSFVSFKIRQQKADDRAARERRLRNIERRINDDKALFVQFYTELGYKTESYLNMYNDERIRFVPKKHSREASDVQ